MSDETQDRMSDATLDEHYTQRRDTEVYDEARRARRREAEQDAVLARIVEAVAGWGHIEGCDRMGECDERASGEECMYHGDETCPGCECGKGEILGILAAPEGK